MLALFRICDYNEFREYVKVVKHIWKFSKKFTSISLKIVEIFLALIFVLGALVLYHLHNEPMDAMK